MLFEYGFYLTKPIWPPICLHDVTRESVAALTDHSAYAFVRENVACVYSLVYMHNLHPDADILPDAKLHLGVNLHPLM